MSDGKFLAPKTVDLLIDTILKKYKKNVKWYIRRFLKPLLKLAFDYLNKGADKIIPDKADALINLAVQQGNAGDWDSATVTIAKAENLIFDISKEMDENEEYEWCFANTNMIVKNAKRWIRRKGK